MGNRKTMKRVEPKEGELNGGPGGSRTPDLQIRSLTL